MIRVICREVDSGAACNVGGPVNIYHKTFDIEAQELEAWLKHVQNYNDRTVIGVETFAAPPSGPEAEILTARQKP